LGTDIAVIRIKRILSGLGLQVKAGPNNILAVRAPSFRQDLKSPIDLVEEIARVYGYAKINSTLPAVQLGKGITDKRDIISWIKTILSSLGLHEVITYSLVDRPLLAKSGIKTGARLVEILNPLSCEQEVLRPAILPSLIRCLAYNLNQQQEYVNIFEAAGVFSGADTCAQEELSLGIALCGVNSFLTKQGLVKDEVTLLHLKGILESLFNKLGVGSFDFVRQEDNKINIIIGREEAGFMLDLSQQALSAFDIKNRQVFLAEINLDKLFGHINLVKKFSGIPKYPVITRDISFVIKDDLSIKDLLAAIQEKGARLLQQAKVVDYYQGKQIPAGFKGLTISCIYRLNERTLTEEEINPLHNEVCSLLKERFDIKLR